MYNSYNKTGMWPDGGAYLDQANILVEVFTVIEGQVRQERDAEHQQEVARAKHRNR